MGRANKSNRKGKKKTKVVCSINHRYLKVQKGIFQQSLPNHAKEKCIEISCRTKNNVKLTSVMFFLFHD